MNKHTPTPWQLGGFGRIYSPGKLMAIDDSSLGTAYQIAKVPFKNECHDALGVRVDESKANAEFIVRAVNAHEALVSGVKQLGAIALALSDGKNREAVQKILDGLVAQAEGKAS